MHTRLLPTIQYVFFLVSCALILLKDDSSSSAGICISGRGPKQFALKYIINMHVHTVCMTNLYI